MGRGRGVLAVAFTASVLVVGLVLGAFGGSGDRPEASGAGRSTSSTVEASTTEEAGTEEGSAATTSVPSAGEPQVHASGEAYPDRPPPGGEVSTALTDPRLSDLSPELFAQLSSLGAEVVRADLTGVGREAFPGYWGEGSFRPCCDQVQIHAAGPRSRAGGPDAVDVAVVWSARRLSVGTPIDNQLTVVHLTSQGGRWVPTP